MAENQNDGGKGNSNSRSNIPKSDTNFGTVAADVVKSWQLNPFLTLEYTTLAIVEEKVNLFNLLVGNRKEQGGFRPQYTSALKTINSEIDGSIKYIKGYLSEEYGEKGKEVVQSYYSSFGIVQKGESFEIPIDASNRKAALDLMIKAITINHFEDKKYGLAYWTNIKTKYVAVVKASRDIDGGISDKVGNKNVLKEEIREVLLSIIYVLKGNFPKTHHEQLRKWGFQKEKY
ncbi:hypothetical protein [Flavobacterium sp. SM2513]|uniref:hypothetical protein n=1 Tax=Flavobacterium sp. SM2513 TaxID=3424766 RepID=UPI003D7FB7CE